MEYDPVNGENLTDSGQRISKHSMYLSKIPPWFDLRVFYFRVSNCEIDEFTPEYLTLNHIPLSPETILEVNGRRCGIYSDGISLELRRDRVDKRSVEATFVSTDSVRIAGSVKFRVFDRDNLLLTGVLEMSNGNGFHGEFKNHAKKWTMKCQPAAAGTGFLRGKQIMGSESPLPTVDVYVTGCFAGTPIILTKSLQIVIQRKHVRKGMLDSIPESDTTESKEEVPSERALQLADYPDHKLENNHEVEDYSSLYSRSENMEYEDGELSWFNAGVRVGVGIGLGICLGIGIGVGLLVRTYQTTTRNFRRHLS